MDVNDPKTIVTPDAFSVDPPLLGTPLAPPWRRGLAILIDIFLVASITALTSGFWFVLGVVAAAFLFTRAGKSGKDHRAPRGVRLFLGCMGFAVLTMTAVVVVGILQTMDQRNSPTFDGAPEMENAEALDLVGDTVGELAEDLARMTLEVARAELDDALQRRSLVGWFTSRLDSLGFGFGWWTLYFAILMPWMGGQTPGKRVMQVRVVRLDGHPITWWHAFERAGGYAAGLATGTLGFAQIYWDANRQGIHDKVAGTVVILDGVAKVPGNWDRQSIRKITPPDDKGPAYPALGIR
jgi:uncharacterized RDD family membrane protein YckC